VDEVEGAGQLDAGVESGGFMVAGFVRSTRSEQVWAWFNSGK
jgi:hypothetical protein